MELFDKLPRSLKDLRDTLKAMSKRLDEAEIMLKPSYITLIACSKWCSVKAPKALTW